MTASIWSPNSTFIAESNATGTLKEEAQVAIAAQTVFNLTLFAFVMNTGSLLVFKNGDILVRNQDYVETSGTRITLATPATAGDKFLFIGFVGITGTVSIDTVLRADLLATGGSSIIGHLLAAAGAVGSTLAAYLSTIPIPLTAFMTTAVIADANADTMLYDHTTQIQAWVRFVVDNQLTGHFNVRSAHITAPIVMSKTPPYAPGTGVSYRIFGDGPTGSAISEFVTPGSVVRTNPVARIFDFSNQAGPAVIFEGISINGPRGTSVQGGDGIYMDTSNGLIFRDCWIRGMTNGSRKLNTSSFIVHDNCVFEFNGTGIYWDDGVECLINNTTYYRNTCDAYLTGTWLGGIYDIATHFECIQYGLRLVGASNGMFNGLTCRQDFAAYTPKLVSLEGASQNNLISKVVSKNFGARLIYFPPGTTATGNRFSELYAEGANFAAAVEIGAGATGNTFSNFIFKNCAIGVVDGAGLNTYNLFQITGMTTVGVILSNADSCTFAAGKMSGNLADWQNSGTSNTLWLDGVESSLSGLTITRIGAHGAGNYGRTFWGAAIPTSLAYLNGDRTIRVPQTVGSPKAWVCTVAGSPGTWVSEGNL